MSLLKCSKEKATPGWEEAKRQRQVRVLNALRSSEGAIVLCRNVVSCRRDSGGDMILRRLTVREVQRLTNR